MSFYLSKADIARAVANKLGNSTKHYPRPTYDELDDPNWEQQEIDYSDEEVLEIPVMRYFEAEDGYISATVPSIGEIIDMIDEIRAEHSKQWQFREK